jgi:hypothetical protein
VGSIATGFDRMFFLSQDKDGLGPVMQVVGAQPIPVSTRALDYQLAQYASDPTLGVADSRGIMIRENGLLFYRLNFTAANHTFVYGISMSGPDNQLWHEEEVLNGDRHPGQTHVYFNGINYYGHYAAPILYRVDSTITTNDGESIRRARIGRPIVDPTYRRRRIDRFQIDLLQGQLDEIQVSSVGLNITTEDGRPILTQAGQNLITTQTTGNRIGVIRPKIYFSISKDGGQTYGYKMEAPMGNLGDRTFRTVLRKLGVIPRGQAFVPMVESYSTVPLVLMGASWDFEVLPE